MKPAHLAIGVLSSLVVAVAAYQFPIQSDLRDAVKEPSLLENVNIGETLKLDSNSTASIQGKPVQDTKRKGAGSKAHEIDLDCASYALQNSLNVEESRIFIKPNTCNSLLLTDIPLGTKGYKLAAFMKAVQVTSECTEHSQIIYPTINEQYITLETENSCGLTLETISGRSFADVIRGTLGAEHKTFLVSVGMFYERRKPDLGRNGSGMPVEQAGRWSWEK